LDWELRKSFVEIDLPVLWAKFYSEVFGCHADWKKKTELNHDIRLVE
jgi:hypothetical protein